MSAQTSQFFGDSIFWIEVEKIKPNPYQPRHEFDDARLKDLAESIRMYGILQPLVVTRKEMMKEDGGLAVEYELISGERRLRASKLAGLAQVPALIRNGEEDARVKLELAIIENLQREDLNPVDRAKAFDRLAKEFGFKHTQIAEKVGKSREYVTNTLRILSLPEEILMALGEGRISEGHTRPLLMLTGRTEEQATLFKEIVYKKLTVREAEAIARKIATDRVRKKEAAFDPEIVELENRLRESLGTRVQIEKKDNGGKIHIDFFSNEDLRAILDIVNSNKKVAPGQMLDNHLMNTVQGGVESNTAQVSESVSSDASNGGAVNLQSESAPASLDAAVEAAPQAIVDDRPKQEKVEEENSEDLYSVKNFVV